MHNMFKNKRNEDYRETICRGAQGCQSFSSYSGCQHGYYQEKGYWKASSQGQRANQEEICCWLGRGIKTTIILCQNNIGDVNRRPTRKFKS